MRTDIPLYIIAVICFISAIALHFYSTAVSEVTSAYVVVLAVLGAIFAGVGYSLKPQPSQMETLVASETTTTTIEEKTPAEMETRSSLELVNVKGIGPKRAAQLKKIGIQTVEELATQSSEELSKKANVSAKVAEKWIREAKKTLEENA